MHMLRRYVDRPVRPVLIRVELCVASAGLWHYERMVWFVRIVAGLVSDAFRLVVLLLRSSWAIRAENLVLRKQLAQYIERGVKPRRVDPVTRISLALLTRLFDWQNAVVLVRPKTIIRCHRAGWRLFWRFKYKRGDRRFQQNCGR